MRLMKWRIAEKKLLFIRKIMMKENSNIARKALLNETFMGLKGLAHECREMTEIMGISSHGEQTCQFCSSRNSVCPQSSGLSIPIVI